MTIYDLPEEISLDEEGHVEDHTIIHGGLKDHEDRIRGVEANKSDNAHKHTSDDITDATTIGKLFITTENPESARDAIGAGTSSLVIGITESTAKAGDYQPTWSQVTEKPSTFTPAEHTHTIAEITDLDTALSDKVNNDDSRLTDARIPVAHTHAWTEITEKPSTFTPTIGATSTTAVAGNDPRLTNARTPTEHTHTTSQVTGLDPALESKANLVGGKIPTSEIPAIALTKPNSVANRAALLALTAEEGDVGIITSGADMGSYMLGEGPSNQFSSWILLSASSESPVQSVNGQVGTVNLFYGDVGAASASHTHTWSQVTGKPSTFTPSAHTHDAGDLTGALTDQVDASAAMVGLDLWGEQGEWPLSDIAMYSFLAMASTDDKADIGHTHDGADITGALTDAVDATEARFSVGGMFGVSNPMNLSAVLVSFADQMEDYFSAQGHTHTWSQISDAPAYSKDTTGDNLVQRSANGHINVPAGAGPQNAPRRSEVDAAINAKIQLVTDFPTSPTPGVLYLKAED